MRAFVLALVYVASVVLLASLQAQSGGVRIAGRTTDRTGAAVPGVTVTLAGATMRRAVTDADGRYLFTDLPTGSYTVTASIPGFQTSTHAVVASAPGSFAVDLALHVGCLFEIQRVDFGLPTNMAAADAILYLRIADAGRAVRVTESDYCVEGRQHAAVVLGAIKSPRLSSDTIRLVRAGTSDYRPGDEVIVFLRRHPSGAFLDFGDYAFAVREGRVRWWRDDLPGVTDGSPVRDVLEGLRNTLSMIR